LSGRRTAAKNDNAVCLENCSAPFAGKLRSHTGSSATNVGMYSWAGHKNEKAAINDRGLLLSSF